MGHHVVVIGGGPAAHRFTESLLSRNTEHHITVITEEPHAPYDRVALSTRLSQDRDLTLGPADFWQHERLTLLTGTKAVSLHPEKKQVTVVSGQVFKYDDVVLATGSSATIPSIPGNEFGHTYRTLDDVDWLRAEIPALQLRLSRTPRVAVVGGGLLGLEAAGGAQKLGAEVLLIHSGQWLMSSQLDHGAGVALGRLMTQTGMTLHLGNRPQRIVRVGGELELTLADGTAVHADLIVFAIGITARDELARKAGATVGERGGVVIDSGCHSSLPNVHAIGEVANVNGNCVGLVAPANMMAEVLADRLCGGTAEVTGIDDATKLKLAGVDVASFGDALAHQEGSLEVVYADPVRGIYQKLVLSDDALSLRGGIFVGDAAPYTQLRPLLGRELPSEPAAYLSASGGEPVSGELPDEVVLCSCNNVSCLSVREAIRGEDGEAVTELAPLKACTRAGTQCGSCVPMLKKLLESELKKSGQSFSHALCEHIELSRSQLFSGIQALRLHSYEDVMHKFGSGAGLHGKGCDICKPVIASILATLHGEYILDGGRGGLQDTNDRALANMQKDGTYSVVPRIPAGEITPTKLKVIAEVAEQFGLYTKITGGQRIDLFGARLEQLPEIWRILVAAGFESGQAYGKALRNVKSCVGSTWCRYGVQDSVGMAIQLELRYRGLRSPHKLKFGVSGCARECAEARGKDVGVIATEAGWNIYVGGNGGFQPAHAQLLVSDVDDQRLLHIIDRYVMYYVRTADRLQRTARWIEELDGGLEHLKAVILDDSLGIAADLEAAMAEHVENYQDEWAATLADPQRLRRFRSFVNAPEVADPSIVRVEERGQSRPAAAHERALIAGPKIPVREGTP